MGCGVKHRHCSALYVSGTFIRICHSYSGGKGRFSVCWRLRQYSGDSRRTIASGASKTT